MEEGTREQIARRLVEALVGLGVTPEAIGPESTWEQLGADSLDVMAVEDRHGVLTRREELGDVRTLGQAIDFIAGRAAALSPTGRLDAAGGSQGAAGGSSSPGRGLAPRAPVIATCQEDELRILDWSTRLHWDGPLSFDHCLGVPRRKLARAGASVDYSYSESTSLRCWLLSR